METGRQKRRKHSAKSALVEKTEQVGAVLCRRAHRHSVLEGLCWRPFCWDETPACVARELITYIRLASSGFLVLILLLASGGRMAIAGSIRPWDSFNGVAFVAPNKWYAVGASGALITSVNGGRTWRRREVAQRGLGSWLDLFSVSFAKDALSGWIGGAGGVVLHTKNGGESWERQKTNTVENLLQVASIDPQSACAVGTNGTILTTWDQGRTWHLQNLKAGLTLFGVDFSGRNGWAVGEFQTILHTTDAGKTWEVQQGGKRADFKAPPYLAVRFVDSNLGWVTVQGGSILWTSNGGATWRNLALPSPESMFGVAETTAKAGKPPTELWMAGEDGTLVMLPLTDGIPAASSHPSLFHPTFYSFSDLAFSERVGVAVGIEGTIVRTNDGGSHWEQVR